MLENMYKYKTQTKQNSVIFVVIKKNMIHIVLKAWWKQKAAKFCDEILNMADRYLSNRHCLLYWVYNVLIS